MDMISPQTESTLRRLLANHATYRPAASILEQAAKTAMLCFVGASCMGKNTIIEAVQELDQAFGITHNITSRPPRAGDGDRYDYYAHTDEGLAPLLHQIETGRLFQYNINPFSLTVYGSTIDGYPHRYNMGDIFASSIDGFRGLGFGELFFLSVVTEPGIWLSRLNGRFPAGHHDRAARLKEAAASLEWSLAQTSPDHCWIINRGDLRTVATGVIKYIRGEKAALPAQADARRIAADCLAAVKALPV